MKSRREFIRQSMCLALASLGTRSLDAELASVPASAPSSKSLVSSDHPANLYPYVNDYSRIMTMKPFIDIGDGNGGHGPEVNLHELLDWLRMIDNLTRGIPKLAVLVGIQEHGHDAQYPSLLLPLNSKLRLPEFPDTRESLIWFMREARRYNTACTVHANLMDAYMDSPLWAEYEKADMFSKDANGNLITTGNWAGRTSYHVSQAKDWREGRMQKRIEALLDTLPTIKEAGVIYFDANVHFEASPWHHITPEDEMQAFKAMCAWMRTQHGMDVVGEYTNPTDYGFIPAGFTFNSHNLDEAMKVPSYLASGGYGGESRVGQGTQIEGHCQNGQSYWKNPIVELSIKSEAQPKEGFYIHNLLMFYLNRLLRISADSGGNVQFSDDVQTSLVDGRVSVVRKGKLMQDGFDVFMPVAWRASREIMAFSLTGTTRQWELPDEWSDVFEVDIYELANNGPLLLEAKRNVSHRDIILELKAQCPVLLVPAGADVNANSTIHSVGEARFLREDRETKGNWLGLYGSKAYDLVGFPAKLPQDVTLNYIGMKEVTFPLAAQSRGALHDPFQEASYIAAARTCLLHGIAEISSERVIEVTLYFAGLDGKDRQILVEAVDPATMNVLAARIIGNVIDGVYTSFAVKGHVYLRLTRLLFENMAPVEPPLLCGIFFA